MNGLAGLLARLHAYRVVELPRRPSGDPDAVGGGDLGRRQRLAGVVAAYHLAVVTDAQPAASDGVLVVGWLRSAGDGPVDVFCGGTIAGARGSDGRAPLSLPPGAVGVGYAPGDLLAGLRAFPCWTRIAGLTDGLLVDDGKVRPEDAHPSLNECLLRVWRSAFAWILMAEPVPPAEIAAAARSVAVEEREARARATSPEHAVRAARLEKRHRELRQGESTGMWRVHLLAGGITPADAAGVAGLLCASADLDHLPYALAPTGIGGDFDKMLLTEDAAAAPVVGSSLLVASIAVAPTEEVPGVRFRLRSEFDVTPETAGRTPMAVSVGAVVDRNEVPVGPLELPYDSLNRHTFVCGATGAGKSQTVRHLLEQASFAGLPWLVVEPAKAEYRQMASRLGPGRVVAIRPGDTEVPPAGFNPLRPVSGFPLQTHLDLTRSLFLAAFQAEEPFPQVLSAALTRCYEELGWDLSLGEPRVAGSRPSFPTLGDLQRAAEIVVDEIGYGREITDNVRGFIRVRLSSLRLGTTGRFFEGGHPLDLSKVVRREVVFEIEDVGDDRDKAFLMGGLLIQLTEHLRVAARRHPAATATLRHLSVFEEAHRLLRRSEHAGPAAHAVELFAALLAEIRAYGEGLVIAEQIPSKLVPDVIKNTAVKVMHRLPAADDREAVGATVNLTERQSQYLVTLPPGAAAVFTDGMDQPLLVRLPDGTDREWATTPITGPVDDLIGRRSATCGPACLLRACTLRDMRTAQHLLDDHPWMVAWSELAVLGHLTGWPTPAIRASGIRTLNALADRTRSCALSHAVDEAVASRSGVLAAAAGPGGTATHVLESMTGYLSGEIRCAEEELAYLARPYRWSRLADDLDAARRPDPTRGRDPRTAGWERLYGRSIPGATVGEQFATVQRWLHTDTTDPLVRRIVAFGVRVPSALERAVGAPFESDEWTERLDAVLLECFVDCRWPRHYLVPVPPTTQEREHV